MEIIPAVGLPVARVGQTLTEIEAAVGPATATDERRAFWDHHEPAFVAHLDDRGVAELIEVASSDDGGEQATLSGIQLTSRVMDDVVADLAAAGMVGTPVDIGYEYDEGFTVWSMASRSPSDLTPGAAPDPSDERLVVEGVGIAPVGYWRDDRA